MPQNATAQKAKDDLTPTQSIVIEALIGRVTVTDAATAGGIDRTTVHRLLRNDFVFQAAYNQARLELHEATMTRLLKLSKAATCTVEHAIQNGDVGTAVALLKGMGLMSGKSVEIGSGDPDQLRSAKMFRACSIPACQASASDVCMCGCASVRALNLTHRGQRDRSAHHPGNRHATRELHV